MKRSQVNAIVRTAMAFMARHRFHLPPFAFWGPKDWARKGREADEIRDCMLGWDITDFGSGDFARVGLTVFTIRNGHATRPEYRKKTYCEKVLIADEGQVTPLHFHWYKTEDIINRGGGELVIRFYNATKAEGLARTRVTISVDGVRTRLAAGGTLTLKPGQSVCIPDRLYHTFWARKGKGKVLVGEVSKVNDDNQDNRFHARIGRFPAIEEDVAPEHLLFSDYPR